MRARGLRATACWALTAALLAACGSGGPAATGPTQGASVTVAQLTIGTSGTVAPPSDRPLTAPSGTRVTSGATTPGATTPGATTPPHARASALTHLRSAIARAIAQSGAQAGVLVYDLTARTTLFSLDAGVARPPASVEKLYTTVAAATLLGPGATFATQVLGTGHLERRGVWRGNLYLRGGSDPTFGDGTFNREYEGGYGPTAAQLASQLYAAGIRRVSGRIYGDESRFDSLRGGAPTGYGPDVPDYGGQLSALTYDHGAATAKLTPPEFAALELVRTLRADHIHARPGPDTRVTPTGAVMLASVSSPPLTVLLKLMDVPSDDLFADLLTKQLGYRLAGSGTLPAGALQVASVLASGYRLHPTIHDGSGLDPSDRSTPAQVVALLRELYGTNVGRLLVTSLPVVGETGTVATIGLHSAAVGHCSAKTGSLATVSNLAGYCQSRGGHVLAFALFIDGPGNWAGFATISKMVAAIAAY